MPGLLPPPAPADPEVVVDADVLDAVAADGVRDQEPARGTRHPWAPDNLGMAPGRDRAQPGPGAQRLRRRRRRRLGDPLHDRTLRHPPCAERDRVAERDDHTTDATAPDHLGQADLDPNPDHGRASDLAHDHARDLGGRPGTNRDPHALGCRTPTAAESEGLGALGWTLLILLVVALAAGWLLWRSRRRSAWDTQAAALEQDTRTATGIQLPPVLTAEDAGQRALSWPPLRAELVDLVRRWELLAERAPDDQRRNRTGQIRNLLQELVAALDAENQALGTGRDWRLLRPRVDQAERALSAVLAGVPQQDPSAGGEPWPPTPGG